MARVIATAFTVVIAMAGLTAVLSARGTAPAPRAVVAATAAPLTAEGQVGRRLLGGRWYFRLDDARVGVHRRYMDERSHAGWRPIAVPYDWNGSERKLNKASVGWYRRELRRPPGPRGTRWTVRFEGAGYHTTVYLNGRRLAGHTGNYLPFEVDLRGLHRGSNRLVVRVSSLRSRDDLTHWRRARFHGRGNGGWWNFGGIHREVTIRPVRGLDVSRAQALPRMACRGCPARVQVRALVRNLSGRTLTPLVTARAGGQTVRLPRVRLRPHSSREVAGELVIARPRLWEIGRGNLYGLDVRAVARGGARSEYRSRFGVRDLRKTADGRLFLNGRRLFVHGISLHEDDPRVGSAWRLRQLRGAVRTIDDLGATVLRSHYPLNPWLLEQADRQGLLVWDSAPINVVQNDRWAKRSVRAAAVRVNQDMVLRDRGHPSVLAFSVADELPIPVERGQVSFMHAAARRVRALDPTRLVALDRVARYGAPDDADPAFHVFDALGINEYFGWYRGALPPRPPAYSADLPAYYDTLHRQQPHAALLVTEFGAEANRHGSSGERGTYEFQSRFLDRHIEQATSRPFLNGAIVWALRDFRVHAGWTGDNPKPHPPWNQKGILTPTGSRKPAYVVVRSAFRRLASRGQ